MLVAAQLLGEQPERKDPPGALGVCSEGSERSFHELQTACFRAQGAETRLELLAAPGALELSRERPHRSALGIKPALRVATRRKQ